MARWKVTSKHYIHAEQYGQPTEWERQETNTDTGRMFRKAYKVPMYIDPEDPYCINKHEGFVVVATKGTERPGDIVFFGPPTMDMEPLDDEARKITEAERPKWANPIEGLDPIIGENFGERLLEVLQRQLDSAKNTSLKAAPSDDIKALREMIEAQQRQIAQLMEVKREPVQPDEPLLDLPDPTTPPPIKVNTPRSTGRRL